MRATILVVEPESALQAALSAWLEWEGYDCACASDADEALAIAEHERTDVALVAEQAETWTGRGLAGALRARQADLAIILHGGAATGRDRQRRRDHTDVLDELPAPLTRGAVTWAVTHAMRWRESPAADRQASLTLEDAMRRRARALRAACRRVPAGDGLTPLQGLAALLEQRNPGACGHARRVAALARAIGEVVHLPPRALAALERAAFLHDVGQAALPEALLRKAAPLSDLETTLLRRHPQIAYEVMTGAPALEEVAPLVLAAQERFDGSGFPRGLAAVEIPLGARIIALADAVDHLSGPTAGGPSRDQAATAAPTPAAALAREAGSRFDPDLVRVWLRLAEAAAGAPQ